MWAGRSLRQGPWQSSSIQSLHRRTTLGAELGVSAEIDLAKVLARRCNRSLRRDHYDSGDVHFPVAAQAIAAGKDVFIEKPITTSVNDALILQRMAMERGRILMVGHLLQYHPHFEELLKVVRSGQLGRLYYVRAVRGNLGRVRHTENALWSLAPHDISMVLAVANEFPSVVAATGTKMLQADIEDAVSATLSFSGGVQGYIFASWLLPSKEQRLIACGEHGMLVFDDTAAWDQKLIFHDYCVVRADGRPHIKHGVAEPVPAREIQPLRNEIDHFLAAVVSRQNPRTDAAEALRVLRVLKACDESLAQGGPVRLNTHELSVAAGAD